MSLYTYMHVPHQDPFSIKRYKQFIGSATAEKGYALGLSRMTAWMNSVQGLGLLHDVALPLGTAERAAVPQRAQPGSMMR